MAMSSYSSTTSPTNTMNELFITCASGLETLLFQELESLKIPKVRRSFGGVYVPKEMKNVYLINYCSRIATRVLWPLVSFRCKDAKALYEGARTIDWSLYIHPEQTFAIDSIVDHPLLRNSLHAALVVKDALCDQLRDKYGSRPSVEKNDPDVPFHLFIDQGRATVSFDTSGAPLYKRGIRSHATTAPIQESLAAALLMQTQYTPDTVFCDPFCGSGTFLIEAAMIATSTPPGFFRKKWAFFRFPEFSAQEWEKLKNKCANSIIPLKSNQIMGADIDPATVEICQDHLSFARFEQIQVTTSSIKNFSPSIPPSFVVCNPPYGKRLELSRATYDEFVQFVTRKAAPSSPGYFLSPFDAIPGLPVKKHFSFFNGGSKTYLYSLKV